MTDPSSTSESHYFASNPPPPTLPQHTAQANAFVKHHHTHSRRVVLLTSGGTTVPLENQTVRFIDNFSAGTRGATSAEYFISQGYAVIFLHRQFSLLPFSRHYSHSTNCFLDFLSEWGRIGEGEDGEGEDGGEGNAGGAATPDVVVKAKYRREMLSVLRKYRKAKEQKLLLLLPFTTVTSYLFTLRAIACEMRCLGNEALFYLAAAVSDFFVPPDRMAEHKIQSGEVPDITTSTTAVGSAGGGKKLVIDLDPVPKFLKRLVEQWAPEAMIVSFKLETDPALLLKKCNQSLERYAHHLVIGNILATRKYEVLFVEEGSAQWVRLQTTTNASSSGGSSEEVEIESMIVPEVIKRHEKMLLKKAAASTAIH
ncbi:DFP-domain-containing protein [Choiromyces venosus 120613-1]|uniref:DFP-domain-containing protein n=1 Tax=Choiromyces venosus 120613-1 TaxID=1336337 RepID=A0A3N4JFW1_9PEZI|nr:DFP-domain-containing protein [Choiromyces venosus 120613-1]